MTSPAGHSRRRKKLNLPKRRWHVLGAAALLGLTTAAAALILTSPAPEIDKNTSGQLALESLPQPLMATNLNSESDSLPDLLAGEIPEGENPTQRRSETAQKDALGNPVSTNVQKDASSTTQETPQTAPSTKPKTVLIDGQPLDSGSAEIFSELSQSGPFGPLPKKTENGNSVFKAYRKEAPNSTNRKSVALIIGGLGLNRTLTQEAIDTLPANVTLSFAAHAPDLQVWIDRARLNGHEVLLEIPMQSRASSSSEPGADHMLSIDAPEKNAENLDWLLSRAQGYFGVINYNGDSFLTRTDAAAPTLSRFSDSGLAFITDGAFSAPSLPALTQSLSLPYKSGFGLIDPEPQTERIETELSRLAEESRVGDTPIGVGFAYPETLASVNRWIDDLPDKSLQLIPASAALE